MYHHWSWSSYIEWKLSHFKLWIHLSASMSVPAITNINILSTPCYLVLFCLPNHLHPNISQICLPTLWLVSLGSHLPYHIFFLAYLKCNKTMLPLFFPLQYTSFKSICFWTVLPSVSGLFWGWDAAFFFFKYFCCSWCYWHTDCYPECMSSFASLPQCSLSYAYQIST